MAAFKYTGPASKYHLEFHRGLDVKNEVLVKLRAKLVQILDNEDVNREIISQLTATLLFDTVAIDPLMKTNYRSQSQRMHELFDLIRGTETEGILICLEKMCDLDNLTQVSKRIIKTIQDEFPGSVHLRQTP